jgi:hypothetical protein
MPALFTSTEPRTKPRFDRGEEVGNLHRIGQVGDMRHRTKLGRAVMDARRGGGKADPCPGGNQRPGDGETDSPRCPGSCHQRNLP